MKIKTKRFLFVLFLLLIALVVFFLTKPAEKVPE